MDNIAEEDLHPWVNAQYNIFTRIKKGCPDEKLPKRLGMTQRVIRES